MAYVGSLAYPLPLPERKGGAMWLGACGLITDFTCEFSDTDEKLNKVKFTWRHSANRPLMDAPLTAGIFDDKFNPTYS